MPPTALISQLDTSAARARADELGALFQDAVHSGASLGFLPPFSAAEARGYWMDVADALANSGRVLWIATIDSRIAGTVQLDPAGKPNGRHRAEVIRLMVHSAHRRGGIARALMAALEAHARALGLTTLVLDTRAGDPSERLYQSLGWIKSGEIPEYVTNKRGELQATAVYYKLLRGRS